MEPYKGDTADQSDKRKKDRTTQKRMRLTVRDICEERRERACIEVSDGEGLGSGRGTNRP